MSLLEESHAALEALKQFVTSRQIKGPHRRFPDHVRRDVRRLWKAGVSNEDIAQHTGLRVGLLYRWQRRERQPASKVASSAERPSVQPPPIVLPIIPDPPVSTPAPAIRLLFGSLELAIAVHGPS